MEIDKIFRHEKLQNAIAVFDFDNTIIQGDLGDLLFFHMAENRLFRVESFFESSPFLKSEVAGIIDRKKGKELLEELASVYLGGRTIQGTRAFEGYDPLCMEPSYAWSAELFGGFTEVEAGDLTSSVIEKALKEREHFYGNYGHQRFRKDVRLRNPVRDLMEKFKDRNVEVWIVSATLEPAVKNAVKIFDLPVDGVIGTRLEMKNGKFLFNLFPDYCENGSLLMPHRFGKKKLVEKELLADGKIAVFGAGDSVSDYEMLSICTDRLVVGKRSLYEKVNNEKGTWIFYQDPA